MFFHLRRMLYLCLGYHLCPASSLWTPCHSVRLPCGSSCGDFWYNHRFNRLYPCIGGCPGCNSSICKHCCNPSRRRFPVCWWQCYDINNRYPDSQHSTAGIRQNLYLYPDSQGSPGRKTGHPRGKGYRQGWRNQSGPFPDTWQQAFLPLKSLPESCLFFRKKIMENNRFWSRMRVKKRSLGLPLKGSARDLFKFDVNMQNPAFYVSVITIQDVLKQILLLVLLKCFHCFRQSEKY